MYAKSVDKLTNVSYIYSVVINFLFVFLVFIVSQFLGLYNKYLVSKRLYGSAVGDWWLFRPEDDSQKGNIIMEQKIVILSADTWKMVDEKTGDTRTGCTIFYVPDLAPICNESGKSYGYKPVKETMPYEFIDKIVAAGGCPCEAKVSFVIRMVGGNQVLKINTCEINKASK